MKIKQCRICKEKKFKLIFSLGKQPLANNLPEKEGKAPVYPLELIQCSHCMLMQLSYVAPKKKMYDNYLYIPSIAKTYLAHFDSLASSLIERFNLKTNDFVVDIGGADGSLSKAFKKRGMRVLNIEPAKNLIKANKNNGIEAYNSYFSKKTASAVVSKYRKAKLVTATNSFAHIDDLYEYLKGLEILLDKDGVFFAQFPDVRNLLKENQFDTIYHEHLSYFTNEPLYHLFSNSPLELFDIESSEIHGGSMRIYVRRRAPLVESFVKNVESIKSDLRRYLHNAHAKGKKIVAFGAAAKGMTLLYHCGLDNKIIDYVADGTPYKQGKFTPGTNIPIVPENKLISNPPDIVLILAWNFKEEIIKKLNNMHPKRFTYIVPIPKMEII